ncbi:anti-sigma-I factor RsgI family protein [Lentibacillus salinarum]|uniref:RsgI N-terminal anti-sigma domain-containing protein n=1 Tax=Lentibacillus salinarum TaxID=446820 RepID=A0ABW3ZSW3_9BACI
MKKGIVMEKHRDYMIVMRKDGAIQKAYPTKNAAIGMEVSCQPIKVKRRPQGMAGKKPVSLSVAAIACLLLLLIPGYNVVDGHKPYAYINITVNPNLELEVDEDLHVQSITPLNDDAEKVLNQLTNYEGDHIEDVIQGIMTESEAANMLQNGKNMLVGVSYMPESHAVSVTDQIDQYFLDHNSEWAITTFSIPAEIREQARENGSSMNRLLANNMDKSEDADDADSEQTSEASVDDEQKAIIHSFYDHRDRQSNEASDKDQADQREDRPSSEDKNTTNNNQPNPAATSSDTEKANATSDVEHPGRKKTENTAHGNENGKRPKASIHKQAKQDDKGNRSKANNEKNGKAKEYNKAKQKNGNTKERDKQKQNNGKAKGHNKQHNEQANDHHKTNSNHGQANGQDKAKHQEKTNEHKPRGHNTKKQRGNSGKKHSNSNGKGPK